MESVALIDSFSCPLIFPMYQSLVHRGEATAQAMSVELSVKALKNSDELWRIVREFTGVLAD
jgi:hypothetical protein